MRESELVDTLFAEMENCVGVGAEERRDRLFPHFARSGKELTGESIRDHIRTRHPIKYGRLHELVDSVCVQWDDWRYAIEHWQHAAFKAVQSLGSVAKTR